MTWKVTIHGKSTTFDDITPETFEEIGKKHGVPWLGLYDGPAETPGAFYDLIVACATVMDVEPPPRPATMGEFRKLITMIEAVETDLPDTWDEGGLPLAVGDPTTESSSGSS